MKLEISVPFAPDSDAQSFFDTLPSAPAVFALFPETRAGLTGEAALELVRRLRELAD